MGPFLGPVGVLMVRSRTLAFWGEAGGLSSFSGEGVLRLRSLGSGVRPGRDHAGVGAGSGSGGAEDLAAIPGIAIPPMPPRPKMGCGASMRVRCTNCVGSDPSCCGACLLSRGPVALPPIKAASDIGSGLVEATGGCSLATGGEEEPISLLRASCLPSRGLGSSAEVVSRRADEYSLCFAVESKAPFVVLAFQRPT